MMPPQQPKKRIGFSIASLIVGIFALLFNCCCFPYISPILGILAVVFGILGMRDGNKGLSIAGIIVGAIGFVVSLVLIIMVIVSASSGAPVEFGFNMMMEDIFGGGGAGIEDILGGGGAGMVDMLEDMFEDLM